MKKFITPVIALLLFCAHYAAAQSLTLSVGSKNATRGQQICVPVTATSGFTSIVGIQTSIRYDPASLQPVTAQNFNLPGLALNNNTLIIPGVNGNTTPGGISLVWIANDVQNGATIANGTVLFELCFNVLNTAAATTQITFGNTPVATEIINSQENSVPFTGQPGTLTIPGGGPSTTPFKITASNESATVGQKVCASFSVDGFKDLISLQYSLQYDATKLRFDSVSGFNLKDLTVNSFGLPGGNIPAGQILFSWSDAAAAGVTVADGTTIFRACFTALAAGTSPINFTSTPRGQEVIDKDDKAGTFSSQNGSVVITGSGGGDNNSNVFKLSLADKTSPSGTTVCLDVTSQGYNDILFMQFSMQYDQTKLQFVSVGSFNLTGLTADNFGLPGSGGVSTGKLTLSWSDPSVAGVTVPDGTNIFQVCFKILMTSGSSTVSFVATPTPIEIVNGDSQIITFSSKSGIVTVGAGGGGGAGGFKISLSDKTVQSGANVCLDLTVSGFKKMISMQFSFGYDATKLDFVSISNLNLQYLSLSKIGTPLTNPPTTAGQISFIWEDESLTGITVPDNTVIAQVCFKAKAANGNTATVSFTETPALIEIVDTTFDPIAYTTKNGIITIGNSAPTILNPEAITNINCFGQSTGAIDITPQGGSGNFTYKWSNNATTQDLSGLAVGAYTVTVTDATTSLTVTGGPYNITQPAAAITVTPAVTNPSCTSPNSGKIVLTVTGGTAPYQYNWNGSLPDNVATQNNLQAGTYTVTITDSKGCTLASGNIVVASTSTVMISSIVPVNIGQNTTGGVNINVSGGTGTYTYAWTGPNNYTSTQKNIANLDSSGQYCVTVTDNLGCSANACATVTAPLRVTGQANRICDGATDGSITLTVNGGLSPYMFKWSNNATTQNLTNVAAGVYSVTITDSQGATNTSNFEVTKYAPVVINANVTPASVGVNNGAVALTISGGTGPYMQTWGNGATTATINNLAPAEYCVTVTDSKGCKSNGCYTVPVQNIPLSISNIVTTGVSCFGGNNGTLSFQINGGRAPYTITFSNGNTINNNNGTVSVTNLPSGDIAYTVTDAAGASTPQTSQISQPAGMQLTNTEVVHDSEESGCTGRISITLTGGKPPYQVTWNAPNTGIGTQIINLCEGNFVPTVVDSNGCRQTFPAITVNTFRVNAVVTAAKCPQDSTGLVALVTTGGREAYAFSWRNSTGDIISTNDTLSNVPTGVYSVRVTEQSGNTLVKQFTLGSTSNLNADVSVISDYNGGDISCPNAQDGILEAIGKSGSGNYAYQWKRDTATLGNNSVLMNASAGTYRVIVSDAIGCKVTKEIKVVAPDSIKIIANIREVSCLNNRDGEIFVNATGGALGRTYGFVWNTTATGARLPFLAPGTYTVTVNDANNCISTASFTLAQPKPIQVQVQTEPATDDCNGVAFAKIEGGNAPYIYQWNSFPNQNEPMIDKLCPGTYFVKITDSRGCTTELVSGQVEDKRFPCSEVRTVITPNDDGPNDAFRITCIEELTDNHLEVYNRWGQLVYQADNYDNSWEGTSQTGTRLPEGPYYYVLEYTDIEGKRVQAKGSITLLRDK